ncbi:MAG: PhoPQ-activated pathogenicity-related protein PqaA type, partial [Candidatus Eremiobacteraeota bacterium]|nr:PhoPQ-activated pathogenicity-related protein PqaA type [Candidatus Eremiobacteraeota bacterium]
LETFHGDGYSAHVVSMVSQRWRADDEVDRPVWKHWLTIIEPQPVASRVGALVITGGSNGDEPPRSIDPIIARLAVRTGAVFAELHMVPNQPLTFAHDDAPRGEDDLVAYTWDRYLRTGDETWPLRLPMTKAAVRAMDTVTALSARAGHDPVVDRFVVGGSSKRGWTAWTTAAADARVVAIVPVVIDVLNIEPSAQHAYRVYGSWPAALRPYEKMGIMKWLGTPQLEALLKIEDPYAYRERLTIPKLIVNATGDQFFAPDSSQFYIGGLLGENYLRYVPNTDHSLSGATIDAAQTGLAFLDSIIAGTPRPRFSWRAESGGTVRVRSATKPSAVKLWQAVNEHARDFRLQTIGRAFHSTELRDRGGFTYAGTVAPPAHGFVAYFVELTYAGPRGEPFTVTTGVQVVPDILPFGPPPAGAR